MRQSDLGVAVGGGWGWGCRTRADTHQICLVFIQAEVDADEIFEWY